MRQLDNEYVDKTKTLRHRLFSVDQADMSQFNESTVLEYIKKLLVEDISSTINLRISTYLYSNNLTLSHKNSLARFTF